MAAADGPLALETILSRAEEAARSLRETAAQAGGFTKAVGQAGQRLIFELDLPKVIGKDGSDGG